MNASAKYWTIWRINPASEKGGYHVFRVSIAQAFLERQKLLSLESCNDSVDEAPKDRASRSAAEREIQSTLFSSFNATESPIDCAEAGLCLRCAVSQPILNACKKLESLFGGDKSFTYQDLLPFVLNDDGKTLVVLDNDGKTQLILDPSGKPRPTTYRFFSIDVLRTFKPNAQSSMSLESWAYLQTKQNPEIQTFLSEFGFQHLSDWALLNRVRSAQLERLSSRDRHLVEAFHAVYRRDRRQHQQQGSRKCPNPSDLQLQEMLDQLRKRDLVISTKEQLLKELKQVATQLRQYNVWSYREPLEVPNLDGDYVIRSDLPSASDSEPDIDQKEFLEFLYQQIQKSLEQAIQQEVFACISQLEKSKRYASFAHKLVPGLQLYYCQNKPLKEIVPLLGMTSWDQARRVLNPGALLNKVRTVTVHQLLDSVLKKAQEKGLTQTPPAPDYLKTLAEQIEAFADAEIFQAAAEEIRAGKNRSMNSIYAQQLRLYIEQHMIEQHMNPLQAKPS